MIRKDNVSVQDLCTFYGLKYQPTKRIANLTDDYNLSDLYELYGDDEKSRNRKSKEINIHDIIFSQEFIDDNYPTTENKSPILICIYNKKMYLIDGNHRCFSNLKKGISTIKAYIIYWIDTE